MDPIQPDPSWVKFTGWANGGKHQRAGFTKNHGKGQGKNRRKMSKASRRINRKK